MRIFFKKIYVDGLDRLPRKGAMFLVSNHPNGFWEPCILALTFPFPLHFLVRGDLFQKPAISWFLRLTNQIPIFRFKDGFSQMRQNEQSRSEITDKLKDGARILLYPEGSTKNIKKLRPLKRGVARMVFDAFEEDEHMDLNLMPVCITFTDADRFRKDIMIKVGNPIDARSYIPAFKENKREGMQVMTDDLFEGMKDLLINIKEAEVAKVYEAVAPIHRNNIVEKWLPVVEQSGERLEGERQLVKQLENLTEDKFNALAKTSAAYTKQLKKLNTEDLYIGGTWSVLKAIFWAVVLAPFAVVGFVLNLIPSGITFLLSMFVIPKTVYYGSISGLSRLGVHMHIYYPIITIIGLIKYGWIALLYMPVACFTEWVFYRWWDQIVYLYQQVKLHTIYRKELKSLQSARASIISYL